MSEEIAPILKELKEALPEADERTIEKELERYLKFGIVPNEAKKAIIRKMGGPEVQRVSLGHRHLSELQGTESSVDVIVKCISSTERMQKTQNGDRTLVTGLVADGTMIRRFVSWEGYALEKGKVYSIRNASARSFRGEVELNLGPYAKVDEAEGELSDLDISKLPRFGPLQEVALKEVRAGQSNVHLKVKVLSAEKRTIDTEKGKRRITDGMLGDDTKRVRFTAWHDFPFEIGDVVSIKGAYVKEWRGIPQINFDERAEVQKLEGLDFDMMRTPKLTAEELQTSGATDVEVGGTVIEIRDGSGLIFRCPACNRALQSGSCSIHGQQEGLPDLRTKIVMDDGTGALFAVLNTEITEQLLGMSVAECNKRFSDEQAKVMEQLTRSLLGKEVVMRGNVIKDDFGPTVLPVKVDFLEGDSLDKARELLGRMGVE